MYTRNVNMKLKVNSAPEFPALLRTRLFPCSGNKRDSG